MHSVRNDYFANNTFTVREYSENFMPVKTSHPTVRLKAHLQITAVITIIITVNDNIILRAPCLMLKTKKFRCYEAKIEENTGGSSQRCPGIDSRPFHFPLFSPHNI